MAKHALYRFYNDSGQLLYTGITNNPERRFTEHAKEKHWWTNVRGISIDWHDDRASVLAAEKRAIRIENPEHNIRDKHASRTDEDEPSFEDLVHVAVEEAVPGVTDEFLERVVSNTNIALARGYSFGEITEATGFVQFDQDPEFLSCLPAYPGQMNAMEIEKLHDALMILAAFLPAEIETFRRMVTTEPENARAHEYEITILTSEVAEQCAATRQRDLELLIAHLDDLPDREELLDRGQAITGVDAIFPMPRDCRTVIELAVACHLGTWPVDKAPTLASLWRELARPNR